MNQRVLAYLKKQSGAVLPDDIAADLKLSTPELLTALTLLEIGGQVEATPGGRYRIAQGQTPKAKTPKAKPGKRTSTRRTSKPTGRKGYGLKQSCSTRRYDKETGKYVPSCDEPQKPEKGFLEDIEVRFMFRCDETGEPAFVKVLGVDSDELRQARASIRKGELSSQGYQDYLEALKDEVQKDLQARFNSARSAEALEKSLRSEQAKKAAVTKKDKAAKVTENDRRRAQDQATALELRIESLKLELARMKAGLKRDRLRNRIRRLDKAHIQLQKIAVGKAYKFPTPSALR